MIIGGGTSRLQLGIIYVLCILVSVRQGFLMWTKGHTVYAVVVFAAMIIGMAAGTMLFFRHW